MVSVAPIGHFYRDIFQPQEFKRFILDKVMTMFGETHPSPQLMSCVDDLVQHVSVRITRAHRQGPPRRPSTAHPTSSNLRRNLRQWQQDVTASKSDSAKAPLDQQDDVDESSTTAKKKKADMSQAYEYTEARAYKSKIGTLYRELQRKLMELEDVPQETQDNASGDLMRPLIPIIASLYIGCGYLFGLAGAIACIFGWSWYASHYLPSRTSALCQMLDVTVTSTYVQLYNNDFEMTDEYLEERIKTGVSLVIMRMTIAQMVECDMALLTDYVAWRNHVWVIGSLASYTVVLLMHYRRNRPASRRAMGLSMMQIGEAAEDMARLFAGEESKKALAPRPLPESPVATSAASSPTPSTSASTSSLASDKHDAVIEVLVDSDLVEQAR